MTKKFSQRICRHFLKRTLALRLEQVLIECDKRIHSYKEARTCVPASLFYPLKKALPLIFNPLLDILQVENCSG